MVTPEIRLFRENKDFRKEFYRYLYCLDDEDQPLGNSVNTSTIRVPFTDIFKLITSFRKGTTCKDIMREFFPEKKMGFDLFRLVTYLNLKGILKRVHSYPVYPPNDENRFGLSGNGQYSGFGQGEEDNIIRVSGIEIKRKYQKFQEEPDVALLGKGGITLFFSIPEMFVFEHYYFYISRE